jgi:hypothetical protein
MSLVRMNQILGQAAQIPVLPQWRLKLPFTFHISKGFGGLE